MKSCGLIKLEYDSLIFLGKVGNYCKNIKYKTLSSGIA